MNLLGIHLTLLIGPTVAVPAPPPLMEALQSVEVTHSDEGQSGFQITFQLGRSGPADLLDYTLFNSPLLKPFNRVIIIVTLNAMPRVLMDGIITHQQFAPGDPAGAATLTITGEDVSVMMDREEKSVEHPAQVENLIALKVIGSYSQYGLIPLVIPPTVLDVPIPTERVPVQQGTDLQYLRQIAERYAYVFYIIPGPAPFTNIAYWGPPIRVGVPQAALTVNMGPETNVESFSVRHNTLEPTFVEGKVQDRTTGQSLPVRSFTSLRLPLAAMPVWLVHQSHMRRTRFRHSSLTAVQALARAQAMTDASIDAVVAEGGLDALRYNNLLQPRALVGVRGAGYLHDGMWYVKSVTHSVRKEAYKQRFTLAREGLGSTTAVVIP
jgi:hypothetical protein